MDWPIRTTLEGPRHLEVGPLDLWLVPGPAEVEVLWGTTGDDTRRAAFDDQPPPDDHPRNQRVRVAVRGHAVSIHPRCAPMSVVARAERPILVGPGRSIRAWVSTPLWLAVETDAGPGPELAAQPVKHTWAGPTTEGQRCVATRTLLRLNLENVPPRDHRVLSTVELHNHDVLPLTVERIALPMPLARLYATDRGLWSETLRLVHRGDRTDADPIGPPRETKAPALLAEARVPSDHNPLKHVFGAVLAGVT